MRTLQTAGLKTIDARKALYHACACGESREPAEGKGFLSRCFPNTHSLLTTYFSLQPLLHVFMRALQTARKARTFITGPSSHTLTSLEYPDPNTLVYGIMNNYVSKCLILLIHSDNVNLERASDNFVPRVWRRRVLTLGFHLQWTLQYFVIFPVPAALLVLHCLQ